jgi:hypothetical protein
MASKRPPTAVRILRLEGHAAVDLDHRVVTLSSGECYALTPQMGKTLVILARQRGGWVTTAVFEEHEIYAVATVINRLRRLIEPDRARPRYLLSQPRSGYALHNFTLEVVRLPPLPDDLDDLLRPRAQHTRRKAPSSTRQHDSHRVTASISPRVFAATSECRTVSRG